MKVIGTDEGRCWNALGANWTIKLSGHDTNGAFALLEQVVEPGSGTPLHVHEEEDETLIILEGEADLQVDKEVRQVGPGTTIHLPRRTPHALIATGDRTCRVLHILAPAGLENYFCEIVRQTADCSGDWNAVVGLSAEYGIRFLP